MCLYVCDEVAFATREEFGLAVVEDITIGHMSEVEEHIVGYVKYEIHKGVCEDAMRAEFKGLVGLNAFEFADVVPDGVNVVSVCLEGRQRWHHEIKSEASCKGL